jgi:hypothetical protein
MRELFPPRSHFTSGEGPSSRRTARHSYWCEDASNRVDADIEDWGILHTETEGDNDHLALADLQSEILLDYDEAMRADTLTLERRQRILVSTMHSGYGNGLKREWWQEGGTRYPRRY